MNDPRHDHARGCEGRAYTCTCGYDAQRAESLQALEQENERLRKELEDADALINALQHDFAATNIRNAEDAHCAKVAEQENERLRSERDAAFAMSKCECGEDEACRNLVAAEARATAAEAALEEARKFAKAVKSWDRLDNDILSTIGVSADDLRAARRFMEENSAAPTPSACSPSEPDRS